MRNVFLAILVLLLGLSSPFSVEANTPSPCPEKFDPDQNSWFIVKQGISVKNPHHVRQFLYEPDPLRRLARLVPNQICVGVVHSYSVQPYGYEKRISASLHSSSGNIYFLLLESGEWKRGYHIEERGEFSQIEGNALRIILYDKDRQTVIAERKISIPLVKKDFRIEFKE